MKLPIIKHLTQFIEKNDQDYLIETIEVLEALTELPSLKEEELDINVNNKNNDWCLDCLKSYDLNSN